MTAKEYLQSQKMFDGGKLERMLEEFARIKWDEACKEQRELCAMHSETPTLFGIIRNAPKPTYKPD